MVGMGRIKGSGELGKHTAIRLSPEVYNKLLKLAAKYDKPISAIIRQIIAKYLAK